MGYVDLSIQIALVVVAGQTASYYFDKQYVFTQSDRIKLNLYSPGAIAIDFCRNLVTTGKLV